MPRKEAQTTGLSQGIRFEPRTKTEREGNRSVATRIKNLLDKQKSSNPEMACVLALDSELLGDSATIFSLDKDNYPESLRKKMQSPIFALSLSRIYLLFRNPGGNKIFKTYVTFMFNEHGQSLQETKFVEDDHALSIPDKFKQLIPELTRAPKNVDVPLYSSIGKKTHRIMEEWLLSMESGKSRMIALNKSEEVVILYKKAPTRKRQRS